MKYRLEPRYSLIALFIAVVGIAFSLAIYHYLSPSAVEVDQNSRQETVKALRYVPVTEAEASFTQALDGCCAVTLTKQGLWVSGDKRFGVIHRGRVFLFCNPENRDLFLTAPDTYSPALTGYDAVIYATKGITKDGTREHSLLYQGRLFLFCDETTKSDFEQSPEAFTAVVAQSEAPRRK